VRGIKNCGDYCCGVIAAVDRAGGPVVETTDCSIGHMYFCWEELVDSGVYAAKTYRATLLCLQTPLVELTGSCRDGQIGDPIWERFYTELRSGSCGEESTFAGQR
jgi:hypothetical protein